MTQATQLSIKQRAVAQLQSAQLFKGIPLSDLEALVDIMEYRMFAQGEVLFRKGDAGDSMYLILSGKVRIFTQDATNNEIDLAYLESARIFGDFVIFDQEPRSASAVAVMPTECLVLYREAFLRFLPQHTFVGLVMMRNIAGQVRRVTALLNKVSSTLNLIASGDLTLALQQLALTESDNEACQTLIMTFTDLIHSIQQRERAAQRSSVP
ncbi:MAG: cyclic nucleotide-binding domain-containing protein [Anaerolineae bacterium]|nr:cyclic nucleotide-binding domain-containing protein [Anaerolineae bacterium]MDW8300252.1 cyclic nucleotide-binding domain-containing protein [Anaerolineae bacterium]